MVNSRASRVPTTQSVQITSSFTTTSTTYVIVTALTVTLLTNTGKSLIVATFSADNDTAAGNTSTALHDDTVQEEGAMIQTSAVANYTIPVTLTLMHANDGSAMAVFMKVGANTGRCYYSDTSAEPKIITVEFL